MEVLAVFLIVVFVIVAGAIGVGIWATAGHLRRKKLSPEGDKVEGALDDTPRSRPEHLSVENEQHSRFVSSR
ncbi:MAG TPA: hypothetical protein VKV16_12005 [Solirubrobacteraceae bacterium]|nr:hypothetical protein [Solirubrobacteraceae bacterium]